MKTIAQVKKAAEAFTPAKLDVYRIDTAVVVQLEEYDAIDGMNADNRAAMKGLHVFAGLAEAMGYKVMVKKSAVIIDSYCCTNHIQMVPTTHQQRKLGPSTF